MPKKPATPQPAKPKHPLGDAFKKARGARYTVLDTDRLEAVVSSIKEIQKDNVPGAVVECGTYKGGNLAVMALAVEKVRCIWGFDSFAGLPVPDPVVDGAKVQSKGGSLKASVEDIEKAFALLEVDMTNVTLVPGLFEDTLPLRRAEIGQIAFLYIDADLYISTKTCLDNLYDQVSVGGIIACDDYHSDWIGSKKAVDEFLIGRGLTPELVKVGKDAVFWKKTCL